ncbi:MAG: phosphoglycerate dehydrogenase [Candidatus Omnitrophica bacterium]|nr:phosphoglycerate dehydrogenase [Candidatus Omnitrophota bacterium]
MTLRIFIALSTFAQQGPEPLRRLEASGIPFEINATGKRLTKPQMMAMLPNFSGVIAGLEPYDRQAIEALPHLKCISRCGVGLDNIDLTAVREKGIEVFTTADAVAAPVAELTIAMILDLLRRLTAHALLMGAQRWERLGGNLLSGKRVGVIGLGRTGRKVAELLRSWGIEVWGADVRPDEGWARQNGVNIAPMPQVLTQTDIVTLHLSVLGEHPFCLGKKEIASMKKGSFLVNVARGSLIDEHSLTEALVCGHLAGAALDVYAHEPYAGPLCHLPNVVLTPHIATFTQESRLAMEVEAVENIIGFFTV